MGPGTRVASIRARPREHAEVEAVRSQGGTLFLYPGYPRFRYPLSFRQLLHVDTLVHL